MNNGVAPPRGVAPGALWRSLLPVRPAIDLEYRLPFAPKTRLTVRAIPSLTFATAVDVGSGEEGALAFGRGHAMRAILSAVLYVGPKRAFASAAEVGALREADAAPLAKVVLAALDRICPTYGRIDLRAWNAALRAGAAEDIGRAQQIAACSDPVLAKEVVWLGHPERYWGLPVIDLLDGHHLAFEAAMHAVGKWK